MSDALIFIQTNFNKLILLMLIIASGIFFLSKDELGDLAKHYAEITAVQGGFTQNQYNDFINDLQGLGVDTNTAKITIKAIDPEGNDLSSIVKNVTPTTSNPYPTNPQYCPRGTVITISVECDSSSKINGAFRAFGINSDFKSASTKKVYMSERVK